MPYFVVAPPPFGAAEPEIAGPFARLEDAEALRSGEESRPSRVVEAADRAAAALARQAWPLSPDA